MICLFSKYFWDEVKCVVEPNSLDLKNLNSKLYALVFTVLKVGYKHLSTNQVRLLHNNKKNSQPDFKYKLLENYPEKKKMFNLLDIGKNSY